MTENRSAFLNITPYIDGAIQPGDVSIRCEEQIQDPLPGGRDIFVDLWKT